MTIEEAIRHYEESEKTNKELAEICVSVLSKYHNIENAEKCRQMIEWLRELQERRKQPELIRCKDCYWWTKQKDSLQGHCELMQMYPTGAWYCGNAKRRTDG